MTRINNSDFAMTPAEAKSFEDSRPQATHTPGPWRQCGALSSDFTNIRYIEAGDDCVTVAKISSGAKANRTYPPEFRQAEALANARLIAAAPDMLAALADAQILLTDLRAHELDDAESKATMAAIEAAIVKARGEG